MVSTLMVLGIVLMGCSEWVLFKSYFAKERYETLDQVVNVAKRTAEYLVNSETMPQGAELDALNTKLEIIGESAEAYLFFTDGQGNVLIASDPDTLTTTTVPLDICRRANAVADPDAQHYHAFSDLGGALTEKSYISVVQTTDAQSPVSGWLFLCSSGAQLTDFKQQFWSNFLLSACVMLLCASVLTRLLMRQLTDPLQKVTDAAQRFGGGDLSVRVEGVEGDGEVADLARTFNQMAENIQSNDIPVFQDSSWGATLSVPSNRLYSDTITLNPQPKSAQIVAKWTQLVGNGMDFGAFFANIAAGMYSKTMAMWTESIIKASTNAQLIPTNMQYTFNNTNWMTAANKLATLNNTTIGDIFATGSMVPLSRVLPTQATGSSNVNMDAALAMLLGSEYNRSGLMGEFLGVRLMPLRDAIVPGTQNTAPATLLPSDRVWMMAGRGYKPMTVCYNRDTPISIEIDPTRTANFEIGINLTIALDIVAVFASRVATFSPI